MSETAPQPPEQETSSSSSTKEDSSSETTTGSSQECGKTNLKSDEMIEPAGLDESCQNMFKKISEYLQCELNASLDDYELLEKLNQLTKQKYVEMDNATKGLITRMEQINEKYEKLKPYLEMIDKVDVSVTNLEDAAYKLDAYSKELEARFTKLQKNAS